MHVEYSRVWSVQPIINLFMEPSSQKLHPFFWSVTVFRIISGGITPSSRPKPSSGVSENCWPFTFKN